MVRATEELVDCGTGLVGSVRPLELEVWVVVCLLGVCGVANELGNCWRGVDGAGDEVRTEEFTVVCGPGLVGSERTVELAACVVACLLGV